jgi:glycosyltransferase involved in cell wall biosynthesis
VLANVVCGAREVIADGVDGLVRDLSTAARIAEEIAAALKDPAALDGTGGRARRTILDHHALQSMTSAYRDVYSRLGGPGAPRPAS